MSNNSAEKTKKRSIFYNISFNGQTVSGATAASKWDQFKAVFFNRFGTVVLLNILAVLFAIPGAVVVIFFYVNSSIAVSLLPYSANFGIGYPVVVDVDSLGVITAFNYDLVEFLLLIPCIALFAVGIAGNLYVMNKLAGGEEAKTFKDFFRGIKKSGLSAFIVGLIFGVILALTVISFGVFDAYELHIAYKIVGITLSFLILVFAVLFIPFFMTQGVCFKISVSARLKNSALLLLGTVLQTIIMTAIAVAPIFTVFIPGFTMFYVMIFVLLGVSYTSLVFTVNCRQCFAACPTDRTAETPATYTKKESEPEKTTELGSAAPAKKKAQSARYKNPKKKKRESGSEEND